MENFNDHYILRPAQNADQHKIWEILQEAIMRRKIDGSNQWQDGYPNEGTVLNDISKNYGYVLEIKGEIAAYTALIFDKEPAYETEEVQWLSNDAYAVVHRVAVSQQFVGQGIAKKLFEKLEEIVKSKQVFSIKVDTNFDNIPMLKILEKLNYKYCGDVYLRGSARKAFEKIVS